jgi:tRNA-splicing ligase RtcB (3'-phosphate/5'-hydroxy nucleic acid ligase)
LNKEILSERIPIKLWTDDIQANALEQAKNLANLPFSYKWIAIMPDCHVGFGMPIGGVLAAEDVIIPNAVGVDIGCGMMAAQTDISDLDTETIKEILQQIREVILVGFKHQKSDQRWDGFSQAPDSPIIQQELASARKQLGTLGGGNHFIEIQKGSDKRIWIMLHSGSRNFGLKAAEYYHKLAISINKKMTIEIPTNELAFLPMDKKEGEEYFAAMNFCCEYAYANRALMMKNIGEIFAEFTGAKLTQEINIHHNYAAFESHYGKSVLVHRKGATKASKDTIGIIPGSMGTSSYIVKGLGNPESFESCSHGAGRKMGRKEAERLLNLEEEKHKLKGIVHGLQSKSGLDEAPGAYKNIEDVMANQKDLVEILVSLKPLGSVKG